MSYFNLNVNQNGIGSLNFDTPNSSVNLLSSDALNELKTHLEELKNRNDIKVLLFKSAKKDSFIAGADINEIVELSDEEVAYSKVREGQKVLELITALPYPTIAVIDGACLGGGMELALCCDFRISTTNSKTKLGLPEVNLGLLPGFGGTQRLKRLIGFTQALTLILSGKAINGKKALKLGMVDACVPSGYLDFKLGDFVNQVLTSKKKIFSKRYKCKFIEKFAPFIIFHFARKKVMKKSKGNYPAHLAILSLFKKTHFIAIHKGLELEARAFASLVIGEVSKNLITLFFTSGELKKESGVEGDVQSYPIKSTSVIGGGIMGAGVVWLFSKKDLLVRLKDINYEQIGYAFKSISKMYQSLLKRRRLNAREVEMKMDHISYTDSYNGFSHIDIALEAIVENSKIKKTVYKDLENVMNDKAIIATNTSSLSISMLAEELQHPERFIGMHFFNPVNKMPLVEVIPGDKTSKETIASVVALAKKTGKTPVVVGDCPGFLVNRVLFPYINESVKMFEEGGDFVKIDKVIEKFGMPMGPFMLADVVGLDIGYEVAGVLENGYGKRMKVSPVFNTIYKDMKLLGKKSGQGFYIHKKEITVNEKVKNIVKTSKNFHKEEILDRAILIMINEAAKCLEEGIVKNAKYLDMAMIMGTGFPPFRGGLLRYADSLGIDTITAKLQRLSKDIGMRFEPSQLLKDMVKEGRTFY